MVQITRKEIRSISKLVKDLSGIHLEESKAYLIQTRLEGLLAEYGFSSYEELYRKSREDFSRTIQTKIINRITTKETLFFRDTGPFELLRHKILPDLIDLRTAKSSGHFPVPIRIWSTACSTGQEVYSIAFVLKELLPNLKPYRVDLLGTDISDEAVARASYGIYNRFEIERGLSKDKWFQYFQRVEDKWKIKDEIRSMVSFRKFNLMDPLKSLGKFDIIFCRNVAIYFDLEDRRKLFEKIDEVMAPDGYLIIGSTESLSNICPRFVPNRHLNAVFYQRKKD